MGMHWRRSDTSELGGVAAAGTGGRRREWPAKVATGASSLRSTFTLHGLIPIWGGGGEENRMGVPVVGWRKDLSKIAHVISLHAWMAYPLELHFLSPHAISWMEDMIERNKRRENVYVIFHTHTFRLQNLFLNLY